jgi:hypothetical protein
MSKTRTAKDSANRARGFGNDPGRRGQVYFNLPKGSMRIRPYCEFDRLAVIASIPGRTIRESVPAPPPTPPTPAELLFSLAPGYGGVSMAYVPTGDRKRPN